MLLSYITIIILLGLGIYTILYKKDLIKIVIGINIIESAVILLLLTVGFCKGGTAPILDNDFSVLVDPIPQALALTAIVIGASTTALMLALIIKLHKRYGTVMIDEIKNLRG
ncbi:MAG: sodium:proton antiporter [Bacillota bacterium]